MTIISRAAIGQPHAPDNPRNVLQIHFQSITTLMPSGYFLLEAPTGFAIQDCPVALAIALNRMVSQGVELPITTMAGELCCLGEFGIGGALPGLANRIKGPARHDQPHPRIWLRVVQISSAAAWCFLQPSMYRCMGGGILEGPHR